MAPILLHSQLTRSYETALREIQMRLTSKLLSATLLAIPALSAANPTADIRFDGVDKGNDYKLTYNGHSEDVFVGSLLFSVDKSKTKLETFCVDLDHFISGGQTYSVDVLQTNSLPKNDAYRTAGDILDAGMATATDKNHAAALQIAIWTAIYGSNFKLSGVSSTVKGLEKSYFDTGLKFKGNATYFKENSNCGQSQITTTPEPASMAVLGIGAFGVFFRRRRR